MTLNDYRSKLEPYFNSDKGFVIVKSTYKRDQLNPYSIILRQGGFVFSKTEQKTVFYVNECIYDGFQVDKVFYTENHYFIDKVLDGTFTESDEKDYRLQEVRIDDQEKDTSDIIDKYGLAT